MQGVDGVEFVHVDLASSCCSSRIMARMSSYTSVRLSCLFFSIARARALLMPGYICAHSLPLGLSLIQAGVCHWVAWRCGLRKRLLFNCTPGGTNQGGIGTRWGIVGRSYSLPSLASGPSVAFVSIASLASLFSSLLMVVFPPVPCFWPFRPFRSVCVYCFSRFSLLFLLNGILPI